MTELAIFAKITPHPAHFETAFAAAMTIVPQTRGEPGCLRFEVNRATPDDGSFYLVERWVDDDALDRHYAQPYTAAIFRSYDDWLAEPVHIVRMRPEA